MAMLYGVIGVKGTQIIHPSWPWPWAKSRQRGPLDRKRTTMVGTPALAHIAPHAKDAAPRCRPTCRHHHADGGDCYLVDVVKVAAVFRRLLGGDMGNVIGIPVKEDHLCRLPSQVMPNMTYQRAMLGPRWPHPPPWPFHALMQQAPSARRRGKATVVGCSVHGFGGRLPRQSHRGLMVPTREQSYAAKRGHINGNGMEKMGMHKSYLVRATTWAIVAPPSL
jgi:hypothetical protein